MTEPTYQNIVEKVLAKKTLDKDLTVDPNIKKDYRQLVLMKADARAYKKNIQATTALC